MSDYREGCVYAKKVKAGIVEPKPVNGKSKRPTPVVLYSFYHFKWSREDPGEWVKRGEYRDEKTALKAAANFAHKYRFMLRFRIGKDGAEFDPRETTCLKADQ